MYISKKQQQTTKEMKDMGVQCERLTKDDLPRWAYVVVGETYGTKIVWEKPFLAKIRWDNAVNIEREPGVNIYEMGWGFAGFDAETATYHRFAQCCSEHVMRVLTTPPP